MILNTAFNVLVPKMQKTPTEARFIVVPRKCTTKVLSVKGITKALNSFLSKIQSFHEKSHFYSHYKRFWIVENSKSVDQINTENTKRISTFESSTLYAKLPHKDQLKVLFDLIDFGFNGGSKKKIDCSLPNAFRSNKPKTESSFTKTSLKRTVQFLIENSYFTVGNVLLFQTVDFPMGIDHAPLWSNLYWCNYESK